MLVHSAALPAGVGHHTSGRLNQNALRPAAAQGVRCQQTGVGGKCRRPRLLRVAASERKVSVGAIHVDYVTGSSGNIYGER